MSLSTGRKRGEIPLSRSFNMLLDNLTTPQYRKILDVKEKAIYKIAENTNLAEYIEAAQKCVNAFVQEGGKYVVKLEHEHLSITVSTSVVLNKRKYLVFGRKQRNLKDAVQLANVALAVAFVEHYFKNHDLQPLVDYPMSDDETETTEKFEKMTLDAQGPITMNPEDSMEQAETSRISSNTEITQAVDVVTAPFMLTTDFLQHTATTLKKITLAELTERNIVIASGTLSSTDTRGQAIFSLPLPSAIYDNLDSSTSTPLRPFTLIKSDLEITLKFNANQAQCGRYVLRAYPCKEQAYGVLNTVFQAVQTEHIEINVANSADAILTIKYENLRPFLPIQSNEIGEVTGDTFTTLVLFCLSPVNVVSGAVNTVPYQVFARFVNPFLTAMRYPISTVEAQGPVVAQATSPVKEKAIETVKDVTNAVRSIPIFGPIFKILTNIGSSAATSISRLVASEDFTQRLENNLVYVGLKNKDKPVDIRPSVSFQPMAQKALCQGLGPVIATKMRLEMVSNTAHVKDMDTVQTTHSMSKIAQIGGIQAFATISDTNVMGDLIVDLPAVPFDTRYPSDTLVATSSRILPPVSYLSLITQGYVGNIEYEILPVKTSSHNFSIMVAYVPFHGTPGTTTYAQAQSCHYKIIDFRTNDSGVFTVPYVSTQMFRQYPSVETGIRFSRNALELNYANSQVDGTDPFPFKDPGKVCIFLVNPLNPTPIVAPSIELIIKMRASSNLQFTIPCAPRFRQSYNHNTMVLRPIITDMPVTFNNTIIPQGPIQVDSMEELPGDEVPPLGGPQVQTMELHDDILNIARRTMRYATLETTPILSPITQAYQASAGICAYIPIVISDPLFQTPWNGQVTVNSLLSTPRNVRDALCDMYRFGRGGVIMSIINHSDQNLILTHLPPMSRPIYLNGFDGTNTPLTPVLPEQSIPLSSMESQGYATVRNVPSVNPVSDIEIPFYNCNYYIDLQARQGFDTQASLDANPQSMINGNFYDVIARTLGTLKIQNENIARTLEEAQAMRARVTVKMSLADDFEFYHFIGVPPVIVDYNLTTTSRAITRKPTRREIQTSLIRAGVEQNPGPVVKEVAPQGILSNTWDFLSDLVSAPSEIKKLRQQGDFFTSTVEQLKIRMQGMFQITASEAASLAIVMLNAYINPSKLSILSAVVQSLVALKIVNDEFMVKILFGVGEKEKETIAELQGPFEQAKQTRHENWLIPLFATAFIEYCLNLNKGRKIDSNMIHQATVLEKFQSVFEGINWFRAGTIMVIMSRIVIAMDWLFKKMHVWLMPTTSYQLLNQNPNFIKNFMEDYAFVMNELNKNSLIGIRQCRDRFWTTLLVAYYLKSLMAKENLRNTALLSAINEMIKKANDLSTMLSSPPVRFEPFVVWTYGPPGVGKSFKLSENMVHMVTNAEIPGQIVHPNPIYTRDLKSQWWNNYHGQPIVLYDDVGTVSSQEVDAMLVGELMAIKSCAVMPIDKPRLEDKETLMTSLVVGIASNFAFVNSSVIRDTIAMDRRRDVLVKCDFTEEARKYLTDHGKKHVADALPDDMRVDDKHLRYGLHLDPTSVRERGTGSQDMRHKTPYAKDPEKWLTAQEFKEYITKSFCTYYNKELENMTKRYKDMLKLCPKYAEGLTDDASIKAAVLQMVLTVEESKSTTTMDTLKYIIHRIETSTPEYYLKLPSTTRSHLEDLRKINLQGPLFDINVGDLKKPHSWLNKDYDPGNRAIGYLKKMYDCIIPWHEPLFGKHSVELDDKITCAFCGKKPEVVSFVCENANFQPSAHVACGCQAFGIVHDTELSCPKCDTKMICVIKKNPRTLYLWLTDILAAAKAVVANPINKLKENKFVEENMRQLIIAGVLALGILGTFALRKHILDDEIQAKFYDYIGEIPSATTRIADKIYITTQNGLRFLCFWKHQNSPVEFIQQTDVEPNGPDFEEVKNNKKERKRQKQLEAEANRVKSPDPTLKITYDTKPSDIVKDWESLASSPGGSKDSIPYNDESEDEDEVIGGFVSYILDKCKRLTGKKCAHSPELVKEFMETDVRNMQATMDKDMKIYWNGQDDVERELQIVFCEEVGKDCELHKAIPHLTEFFMEHSEIWNISVDQSLIHCVPEVYYLYLESRKTLPKVDDDKYSSWQRDLCTSITTRLIRGVKVVWEFMTTHYKMFLGALTVIYCIYKGLSWYTNKDGILEPVEAQGSESSTHVASRKTIRNGTTRQLMTHHLRPTPNGLFVKEPNQNVVARADKIRRNYFHIRIGSAQVWGLGLFDHVAIMTRHNWHYMKFFAEVSKNEAITIVAQGRDDVSCKLSDIRVFHDSPSTEHVYLTMPSKGMQAFANIRSAFLKGLKDGEPTNPTFDATVYYIDVTDMMSLKAASIRGIEKGEEISTKMKIDGHERYYQNMEPTAYEMITTTVQAQGLCLSAYLDKNANIIGLHVAGNPRTNTGYAIPIFQELIPTVNVLEDDEIKTNGPVGENENLTYITTIFDAPYHTHKSKIIPNPLQEELYTPEKFPCIQSKKDPRYKHDGDPLLDGAATIGNPTKPLQEQQLYLAYESVKNELLKVLPPPYTTAPVSEDEVLYATQAPASSGMNLSTSVGYPLTRKTYIEKQKRDFLTMQGDLKPKIRSQFDHAYRQRTNGDETNTIFWAHLKDELRKEDKLMKKGGTRVFSVAPFELVFNARRALLPFMDAYQTYPIESHHAIGLNPNSNDWTRLKMTMLEKGDRLLQMDFKNYSDAIPTECVRLAFLIIKDYYRKFGILTLELEHVINTLYRDTAKSKILIYDSIYRVNNGVLAGHPLTSIVNSIVNLILQVYIWTTLTKRRGSEFFLLTYIIVMGDDVVIAVPRWLIEEYNCTLICAELAKYNIIATDSSKNLTNIKPYDDFEDFEFLSRGMSTHHSLPGITLAPVKTLALFDCPLWINKGDEEEQIIQSIQAALLLAFDHGPIFFERFRNMLIKCSKAPDYSYFTWLEILALFHGTAFNDDNIGKQKNAIGLEVREGEKKPTALALSTKAFAGLNGTVDANLRVHPNDCANSQKLRSTCATSEKKMSLTTPPVGSVDVGVKSLSSNRLFATAMYNIEERQEWKCGCKYDCISELEKREREVANKRNVEAEIITWSPKIETMLVRRSVQIGEDVMSRSHVNKAKSGQGYMSHSTTDNKKCVENDTINIMSPEEGYGVLGGCE